MAGSIDPLAQQPPRSPSNVKLFKKVGALTSASALTGLAVFAAAVGVANAAPVTLVIEPQYLAPGETATLTVDGCAAGSTLSTSINGEVAGEDTVVTAESLPITIDVAYEDDVFEPGTTTEVSVTCTPAEGSGEAPSTASDSITLFGASYFEAIPDTFYTGETVSITAGDFLPGAAVTMYVIPEGGETSVHSAPLGTAGPDFSVTGDVVFPEDLECGTYVLEFSDDEADDVVTAELNICGAPDEPEVTASPSASPSVSPSASATPSVTPMPSRPSNPGLPSTGC